MKFWLIVLAIIPIMGCATTGMKEDALKDRGLAPASGETKEVSETDDKEKAKTLFNEGLKLMNDTPRAALNLFNEVVRISPKSWEAYYNLGLINIKLGDFERAEVELIKSLNKKAPPAKIYNALGMLHLYNGKRQKAIETFEMSLTNEKTPTALVNLAGLYLFMGQTEKAVKYYREAEAIEPANGTVYMGLLSYAAGGYEAASESFKKALDNGNKDTRIMSLYAQALLKQGDYNTAIWVLQELYALAPSDPNPYRDMGIIYELYLGDLNKAAKNYNLYIDYGGEKAKEVREWVNILNTRLSQENKKDGR